MDLIDFIRQRISEDEAQARAATAGPWRYDPTMEWHQDPEARRLARAGHLVLSGEEFVGAGPLDATIGVAATGPSNDPQSMADAAHIARHDPARVLRQAAAHRKILHMYQMAVNAGPSVVRVAAFGQALRHIATTWSDHPDYDRGWRP